VELSQLQLFVPQTAAQTGLAVLQLSEALTLLRFAVRVGTHTRNIDTHIKHKVCVLYVFDWGTDEHQFDLESVQEVSLHQDIALLQGLVEMPVLNQ
jgi:hypothetical protein